MALTRGRVLAGDAALVEKLNSDIAALLSTPRDGEKLAVDVADMRARLRQHQPQAGPFDIRRGDGGLVDIEFIAQSLQLRHAPQHGALIGARALTRLLDDLAAANVLDDSAHQSLSAAAQCFLTLRQIASLCLEDSESEPAPAIAGLVLEALNEPDLSRLHGQIDSHRAAVTACFDSVLAHL